MGASWYLFFKCNIFNFHWAQNVFETRNYLDISTIYFVNVQSLTPFLMKTDKRSTLKNSVEYLTEKKKTTWPQVHRFEKAHVDKGKGTEGRWRNCEKRLSCSQLQDNLSSHRNRHFIIISLQFSNFFSVTIWYCGVHDEYGILWRVPYIMRPNDLAASL